ncbi:MAG: ABC transporter ATP-binding protein [Thermoplasmata archaeon]
MSILTVRDLHLYYRTSRGPVRAVDNVGFEVERGQTLALVGESGCGKSSTANAILRVLPRNVNRFDGMVQLDGQNVMDYDHETFRTEVRWKGISMVFQGAMNALNPVIKVGRQVAEPLIYHADAERSEAIEEAERALMSVGLPSETVDRYPHELSGGMKQRAVIAMAIILHPHVIILDEPTSALDVMTQANIINLLKDLRTQESLSYIFITHDLALASELADRVAIMYAGRIVEIGSAEQVYTSPLHPYTRMLMNSVPRLRSDASPESIPGSPPDLVELPEGCRFRPRCPFAFEKCTEEPSLLGAKRLAACWLPEVQEAS